MSALGAVGLAWFQLFHHRLPRRLDDGIRQRLRPIASTLQAWHTGVVSDYVVWVLVGVAVLGLSLLIGLR